MRKADNLADLTNLYYIITWEYSLRIYSQIHITCEPFWTITVGWFSSSLWCEGALILGNQNGSHVIWIGLYFWLIIDLNMFWERSWRSIFYEIWSRNDVHSEKDTFDDLSGLSRTVCPRLSKPVPNLSRGIPLEILLISRKTILEIPSSDWSFRWTDEYDWLGQWASYLFWFREWLY